MALKFKEPHVITATYRIVTPMFIGDAYNNPSDGIRPPSVKGALRFWWRALMWGTYWKEKHGDEVAALKALHEAECKLFGQAMDEKKGSLHSGQGCFSLTVIKQPDNVKDRVYDWPPNTANHGASYLAFGLLETQDDSHRSAIPEGKNFTLQITFRPKTLDEDIQQVNKTLEVWSLFGGLGSRSRRSFGSVSLVDINGEARALLTKNEYKEACSTVLEHFTDVPTASFTTFSKDSVHALFDSGKEVREVVRITGEKYKQYRSDIKKQGDTNGRIAFGLPLQNIDLDNRRSSPLLFHAHALDKGTFVSSALYMPSKIFHPRGDYPNLSMQSVKAFISGDKA